LIAVKAFFRFLLPSIFVLVALFKGWLDYLMILTCKICKAPVMYAIKTGNTDHGSRWKNLRKWLLVIVIRFGGISLAVWTRYGRFWLLWRINTLEITPFIFRWFAIWGV